MPAILGACQEGRVAALLVRPDHLSWACSDTTGDHPERLPGDIDRISAAIAAALAQGATIHPVGPCELPAGVTVAAVPRY